ncbi:MAG: hypothetical protein AAF430_06835 [Myxococcota bacterium]
MSRYTNLSEERNRSTRLRWIPPAALASFAAVIVLWAPATGTAGRISNGDTPHAWFEGLRDANDPSIIIDERWDATAGTDTGWVWKPGTNPTNEIPPIAAASGSWLKSYVSYHGFEAPGMVILDDALAEYRTGQLYIGGWDADHLGDPPPTPPGLLLPVDVGATGTLRISDGKLQVGKYASEAGSGDPEFTKAYLRVGYFGARGLFEQTGGEVHTTKKVSIAMGSADSIGVVDLKGGELRTPGVDVGVQGLGILHVSGGHLEEGYDDPEDPNNPAFDPVEDIEVVGSSIGRGYSYTKQQGSSHYPNDFVEDGSGRIPGIGIADFSGGTSIFHEVVTVGTLAGSFGVMHVRNDATVTLNKGIRVGDQGMGSLIVDGGTFSTKSMTMGSSSAPHHTGQSAVTIRNGSFTVDQNLGIGNVDGTGVFTVIGHGADIDVGGNLTVSSRSQLRFEITTVSDVNGNDGIAPIVVAGNAHFSNFPKIHVLLEDIEDRASDPVPSSGTVYTLVSAGSFSGPQPTLVADAIWTTCYDATNATISAVYDGTCP